MKVRVICIDNTNKPTQIPEQKWPQLGKMYNITWIYKQMNQPGVAKGCELAEFDISMHNPYNCYRLDRFAVLEEDWDKLMELFKLTAEFNEQDISAICSSLTKVKEEDLVLAD